MIQVDGAGEGYDTISSEETRLLRAVADALDGHALRNGFTPFYEWRGGLIMNRHHADIICRKDAKEYAFEADFLAGVARSMIAYRKSYPYKGGLK